MGIVNYISYKALISCFFSLNLIIFISYLAVCLLDTSLNTNEILVIPTHMILFCLCIIFMIFYKDYVFVTFQLIYEWGVIKKTYSMHSESTKYLIILGVLTFVCYFYELVIKKPKKNEDDSFLKLTRYETYDE